MEETAADTPSAETERIPLLIVGLGNVLLGDDGVGVHAARALQVDPPAGALVIEVGTAVLDALHLIAAADRIIALDAVQAGQPPGTIYSVDPAKLGPRAGGSSLHELDLLAAMRLMPQARVPALQILGVEPARIDYGLVLSPVVKEALPAFLEVVRKTALQAVMV